MYKNRFLILKNGKDYWVLRNCELKGQQEEAFEELLTLMGANGGKVASGAKEKLIKTNNINGFKAVNW